MIEVKTKTMKNLLKPHLPITEYGLFVEMCEELETLRRENLACKKLISRIAIEIANVVEVGK